MDATARWISDENREAKRAETSDSRSPGKWVGGGVNPEPMQFPIQPWRRS